MEKIQNRVRGEMVKKGLVLEGGAMRGMFTCGVTDVLMENHVLFDGVAGISAGAVFGCNVKSGQIGRAIRYNKKYARDPRFCSLRSWFTTGDIFGADFCYHELPEKLDPFDVEAFQKNPMEFYVGATDVQTGRCVYHKCETGQGDDILWMRASASMPLVSKAVTVGGYTLLDGGICNSIPFEFMEHIGYDRNVIILTQPEGYQKPKVPVNALTKFLMRKYPAICSAMENRHNMYNRQLADIEAREKAGRVCVVRPPESLGIHRTERDPGELERVYQIGRKEGERQLRKIQEFLGETDE